jgi:hypothetical protein
MSDAAKSQVSLLGCSPLIAQTLQQFLHALCTKSGKKYLAPVFKLLNGLHLPAGPSCVLLL